MALSIYDIIRSPIITEKTSILLNNSKKVTFEVHARANKKLVREALQKLFGVQVESVNILNRAGKKRVFKRIESHGKTIKRAIVTLKDSESFDKIAQIVSGGFITNKNTSDAPQTAQE